ncbi:putative Mg2+ transporter-C (MgtC) family protein [Rhodoblastus acidophilus]|uniref:MgtC/SapB family protein n=1 Tax=Rhodoblastus acidophilus TaxID=1074 RepID=UPI0022241477|nr:MgtC/SapB family protein [Rhodoblastus acidophilus]MCW2285330.1 putative Mg2+ transporter-C (MgtC) family protein [Rhodoblastus acidophilus]MCW2334286.1 putative Mg2+ transporter-C (MgtC) family protein [Rhodoblastus acidophilus]
MTLEPSGSDIALRLALTLLACGALGLDRSSRGRTAGLRTLILVGLAAATATILMSLLTPLSGKAPDSFVMLDPMRLPLGILTGMGFIGGGVILKRGDLVIGVTTAATLWLATVLGLCFGAGELQLGGAAAGLGLATVWGLKRVEERLPREHRAVARLTPLSDGKGFEEIEQRAAALNYRIRPLGRRREAETTTLVCEIIWTGARRFPLDLMRELDAIAVVHSLDIPAEPE